MERDDSVGIADDEWRIADREWAVGGRYVQKQKRECIMMLNEARYEGHEPSMAATLLLTEIEIGNLFSFSS